jgi:putative nucleotidyltransferase with HDIG domain
MRNEVFSALPELALIQDVSLREQVVKVWIESLQTSGFTVDEMKEMPFTLLVDSVGSTFLGHVRSVSRMCLAMADVLTTSYGTRMPINRDVLLAGALLADVGKMIEFEKRDDGTLRKGHRGDMLRHPFSGVAMAFKHGLPFEVMHIIAVHSKEGDFVRRSPEAIIYHYAANADFDLAR